MEEKFGNEMLTLNYPTTCIICHAPTQRKIAPLGGYFCSKCGLVTVDMVTDFLDREEKMKRLKYKKRKRSKKK